nr:hypothetical protein [Ktedonosporobacter rubrisoli]
MRKTRKLRHVTFLVEAETSRSDCFLLLACRQTTLEEDKGSVPSCHIPTSLSTSHLNDLERNTLMPLLDLSIDELLTTTRTVRKRLDLTRPVEAKVIIECL